MKQGLDQARQQTNQFTRDMEAAIKRTQQSLGVDRVAAGMSFAASGTAKWQEGLRRLADQSRATGGSVTQLGGDVSRLGDHIADAVRSTGLLGGSFGGLERLLAGTAGRFGLVATGIAATGAAMLKLIEIGANEERSQLRLEAVIRATGATAGFSAKQVKELSAELSRRSMFNDDDIRKAATQLATFGNISGQVFRDTLAASLDLAETWDRDLGSTILAVGRAIESPKEGMESLRRLGVVLSEEQKKQITNLVEQNRLVEAQNVLVNELKTGVAEGAAGGLAGRWHRVKVAIDDATKSLGAFAVRYAQGFLLNGGFGGALRGMLSGPGGTNWDAKDQDALTRGRRPGVFSEFVVTGGITPLDQTQRLRELAAEGAATQSEVKRLRAIRTEYADALKQLNATTASSLGMTEEALRDRRLAIGRELKALNDLFTKQGPGKFMLGELERQHQEITEFFQGFDLRGAQPFRDALRSEEIRIEESLRDLDIRGRELFAQQAGALPLRGQNRPTSQAAAEIKEAGRLYAESADLYRQTWKNAIEGVQRSFADFFSGLFEQGTSLVGFFKSVANAIRDAFANLLSAQITGFLFKSLGMAAPVKHAGGLVGDGGPSRLVSPLAFLGAARLHQGGIAGLKPDEVPAILQRGETVLPRGVSPVTTRSGDTFNISIPIAVNAIDGRGMEQAIMSIYPAVTAAAMRGVSQSRGAQRFFRGG